MLPADPLKAAVGAGHRRAVFPRQPLLEWHGRRTASQFAEIPRGSCSIPWTLLNIPPIHETFIDCSRPLPQGKTLFVHVPFHALTLPASTGIKTDGPRPIGQDIGETAHDREVLHQMELLILNRRVKDEAHGCPMKHDRDGDEEYDQGGGARPGPPA